MKRSNKIIAMQIASFCATACLISAFSHSNVSASANAATDLGTISFQLVCAGSSTSSQEGFYLTPLKDNDLNPTDWLEARFYQTESGNATLNGDNLPLDLPLVKYPDGSGYCYYLALSDVGYNTREANDTITIEGTWTCTFKEQVYTTNIRKFTTVWDGSNWQPVLDENSLEYYDVVSLSQSGYDDFDGVSINTEDALGMQSFNSFALSEENTTGSYSYKIKFKPYEIMTSFLAIRIGSSGNWVTGWYYQFYITNQDDWGPVGHNGVLKFQGCSGDTVYQDSGDILFDLQPNVEHELEFGVVRLKESTNYMMFTKGDGKLLFSKEVEPMSGDLQRTTRVGIYYASDNIFLGNAVSPRTCGEKFTPSTVSNDGNGGVFFNLTATNNVPTSWENKLYNATTDVVLLNGHKMFDTTKPCLSKPNSNEYYLSFKDFGKQTQIGDILSINGEFHTVVGDKAYYVGVEDGSYICDGDYWKEIDLPQYLYDKLENSFDPIFYDEDKLTLIEDILSNVQNDFAHAINSKEIWKIYQKAAQDIANVPYNEEKAEQILNEFKELAIQEITTYVNLDNYTENDKTAIEQIINNGIEDIRAASNKDEIEEIVEQIKTQLDAFLTKDKAYENDILNGNPGYEALLEKSDVATLSDLGLNGDVTISPFGTTSFNNLSVELENAYSIVPTSKDNTTGSISFQFKYSSTNPSSNQYGSQIFLRMRGDLKTNYIFLIGTGVGSTIGVTFEQRIDDVIIGETAKAYAADFVANNEYVIECGAIDIKDLDRTFVFVKIDGEFVIRTIVDSITSYKYPTVLIADSYTAADSGETVTLKSVESGTSKANNAKKIGRFSLAENNTNKNVLNLSLKENEIPIASTLYFGSYNAVAVNGVMPASLYNEIIIKASDTKYTINLEAAGYEIEDGDTLIIDGYFFTFDNETKTKQMYQIKERIFIYSFGSWREAPLSLDAAKEDAIDYLNSINISEYSEENASKVQGIVSKAIEDINAATTLAEVNRIFESAVNQINQIETILGAYRASAKDTLKNYKSADLFRDKEKERLVSILNDAYAKIDAANNEETIDRIVAETKLLIDSIKTDAQYSAEELKSAISRGKATVETYFGMLELERYSEADAQKISQMVIDARNAIENATSVSEVDEIVKNFKASVNKIKTTDGLVFDGEKYVKEGSSNGLIITLSIVIPVVVLIMAAVVIFLIIKNKKNKSKKVEEK